MGFFGSLFNSDTEWFRAYDGFLRNVGIHPSSGYEKCENCALSKKSNNRTGIACTDRGDPELVTFANYVCEFFTR